MRYLIKNDCLMDQIKNNQVLMAFLPIIILIAFLAINVYVFGDNATGGPNQVALLFELLLPQLVLVMVIFGKRSKME